MLISFSLYQLELIIANSITAIMQLLVLSGEYAFFKQVSVLNQGNRNITLANITL